MTAIAILIPVLNRPQRVAPLVESIRASGRLTELVPWFLLSPCDHEQEVAVLTAGAMYDVMEWQPGPGDYARKINRGFRAAAELGHEFIFLGADDILFHPGWAERALAAHLETGACVIGTNDGGNARVQAGEHATHSLVHRDYLGCGTVDETDRILHEGYEHNWVDNEFVGTARWRGTFAAATDSVVEHHHPFWGKATDDDTYRKGKAGFHTDHRLYEQRRHLWGGW